MSDLTAIRGDTNIYNVVVVRQDAAVNIMGAKVWFTAKHVSADPDAEAVISLDTDSGGVTMIDAAHGRIQIAVPPEDTAVLEDETALLYDVQLRENNGVITTIAEGKLTVLEDITQATA